MSVSYKSPATDPQDAERNRVIEETGNEFAPHVLDRVFVRSDGKSDHFFEIVGITIQFAHVGVGEKCFTLRSGVSRKMTGRDELRFIVLNFFYSAWKFCEDYHPELANAAEIKKFRDGVAELCEFEKEVELASIEARKVEFAAATALPKVQFVPAPVS